MKFDLYDPNTKVKGQQITGSGFSAADISYSTLGIGYNYYLNPNLKIMCWYDRVWNERTALTGYLNDVSDDVVTIRFQYRL